jgi:hypothetical protein
MKTHNILLKTRQLRRSAALALIEAVAREAKVEVAAQKLFADGIGEPGSPGETYQKMLMSNTKTIVEGLGGTFTAFQGSASPIGGATQVPASIPGR